MFNSVSQVDAVEASEEILTHVKRCGEVSCPSLVARRWPLLPAKWRAGVGGWRRVQLNDGGATLDDVRRLVLDKSKELEITFDAYPTKITFGEMRESGMRIGKHT